MNIPTERESLRCPPGTCAGCDMARQRNAARSAGLSLLNLISCLPLGKWLLKRLLGLAWPNTGGKAPLSPAEWEAATKPLEGGFK